MLLKKASLNIIMNTIIENLIVLSKNANFDEEQITFININF